MLEFLQLTDLNVSATTMLSKFLSLGVACLCGLFLSWLYRRTYRGSSYSMTFNRSLVTLTIITAIVIMVIGDNLARAFGLVGAMSIIRFRTALKDAQDLVFVFFSLALGLASGVGLHALAAGSSLFVGGIIFVMARMNYGAMNQRELVVQIQYSGRKGEEPARVYGPVLERFCKRFNLLGARSGDPDRNLDMTFYVLLRTPDTAAAMTAELAALPQIERVNVFYDDEPL